MRYIGTADTVSVLSVRDALRIVDSRDLRLETPDIKQLFDRGTVRPEDVRAEIHEIVTGRRSVRRSPEDRIVIRAVGLAYQDVALAHRAVTEASRKGIGMLLPAP